MASPTPRAWRRYGSPTAACSCGRPLRSTALRAAVETLGPVRHFVSRYALHHLFLAEWASAYPEARLYAPLRLRRKRRDLSFNAELGDTPEPRGLAILTRSSCTEALHSPRSCSFTVIAARRFLRDLIHNFPRDWFRGWRAVVAGSADCRSLSEHAERLTFEFRQPAGSARGTSRVLAWPIERVVIAHGSLPTTVPRPSCGAPSPGWSDVLRTPNTARRRAGKLTF